jgi:hypothetical protein
MRHDLLVGFDAELREYVSLVADVVDHVWVIVAVHRADPLVHQRPVARLRGLQRRPREHLLEVGDDRARLIQHEVGVLEDRHAVERMQREVLGRTHVGFEVMERVRHFLVRQHQSYECARSCWPESQKP